MLYICNVDESSIVKGNIFSKQVVEIAKKENNGFRYPDGVDAEIFTFSTIETVWKNAKSKLQREHVTPFIWQNPNKFKLGILKSDIDRRWLLTGTPIVNFPSDIAPLVNSPP